MKILLTNDDGIKSPAISLLFDQLSRDHEVWVMAPHTERSACSQSITTKGAMIVREVAEKRFSCSGTPADCVLVALKGYFDFQFDLVLSGINRGPNLGSDIIYSGTAAGARQGAMMGVPAAALSLCLDGLNEADYSLATKWVCRNLDAIVAVWKPGFFLNINFPVTMNELTPVVSSVPGTRIYHDKLEVLKAPDKSDYCFFTYQAWPEAVAGEDFSDALLSNQGLITLSEIAILPGSVLLPEARAAQFKTLRESS
ncbi:MAG: 5'/3'-nucleotidase SurE [Spirochaetales bacterium]|nr:5'/3'-nucleotidase SurE [Spirochaetales bacterium]